MYTNLDIYCRAHYSIFVYTSFIGNEMSNESVLETIGIREFRNKMKETLERVDVSGERILLGKHGKSVAALVPVEDVGLAVKMEQQIAESALLNEDNLPQSTSSETSLDELMADYAPNEYDSSRYGAEEPGSLIDELNKLSCVVDNSQIGIPESRMLAGVIRELAEKISSSSDTRSVASALRRVLRKPLDKNTRLAQAPAEVTVVSMMETNRVYVSTVIEPTEVEIAAEITDVVQSFNDQ